MHMSEGNIPFPDVYALTTKVSAPLYGPYIIISLFTIMSHGKQKSNMVSKTRPQKQTVVNGTFFGGWNIYRQYSCSDNTLDFGSF